MDQEEIQNVVRKKKRKKIKEINKNVVRKYF